MKKIAIIMLLIAGAISLKAQDGNTLVAEGKRWNVLLSLEGPSPTPQHRTTTSYKIQGDTLLDGMGFRKLLGTSRENLSDWQLHGAIRETETGQVFFRAYKSDHTFEEQDRLLYDFSMQPGDAICFGDFGPQDCLRLLRVNDTVLEGEDTPRKKFVLQYEEDGVPAIQGCETWIEGIGSEYGLLGTGSRFLIGGAYDLLCYYEEEDLVWQNPEFDSCYYGTVGLSENGADAPVSVCPNPATSIVAVVGTQAADITVYNAMGQLLKTVRSTNEISLEGLPQGVYTLRIADEKGFVVTRKVVKE